jgi:hypothetical protein
MMVLEDSNFEVKKQLTNFLETKNFHYHLRKIVVEKLKNRMILLLIRIPIPIPTQLLSQYHPYYRRLELGRIENMDFEDPYCLESVKFPFLRRLFLLLLKIMTMISMTLANLLLFFLHLLPISMNVNGMGPWNACCSWEVMLLNSWLGYVDQS